MKVRCNLAMAVTNAVIADGIHDGWYPAVGWWPWWINASAAGCAVASAWIWATPDSDLRRRRTGRIIHGDAEAHHFEEGA